MNGRILFITACLTLFISCSQNKAQVSIVEAFPNLTFNQPVDIQNAGDGSNRLFVLSQEGIIHVFHNEENVSSKKTFLDIREKVLSGGEQGLLGLAFHPDYESNGYFYVDYTASNPRRTVIARYKVSGDPDAADKNSEQILMEVAQPYSNHNGGQITFGPDGYLYISFGDGGAGGDPQGYAQNLKSELGKILRIDVNNSSGNKNYSIPNGNPFKGNTNNLKEEIYAWGLRNVWRFSFDGQGKLWAADVGQNAWEEINIIEAGKNYGWNIMEGLHCFTPSSGCDETNLTKPIWEYAHNSSGGYSVTGGFVYNGNNAAELIGNYIYGDYVSGNIWRLEYKNGSANNSLLSQTNYNISTFGVDENNELYFADYSGKIYKFKGTTTGSVGEVIKNDFKLYQNYPNPFNPSTTIAFELPVDGQHAVHLQIWDILGNQIISLINGIKLSGLQNINFNADGLTSGIYYYSLTAGSYRETKKMTLLR